MAAPKIKIAVPVVKGVSPKTLVAYERNPRRNDDAVDRMVSVIEEFGFRVPILVKKKEVVDGHLRLKAALKMGLAQIPAIDVSDMPEDKLLAFRLMINRSAEWADWDDALLAGIMAELNALDADLALTGFEPDEISGLLKSLPDHGAFLEGVGDGEDDGEKSGVIPPTNLVQVTFTMGIADRGCVLDALELERGERGLKTAAETLVAWAKDRVKKQAA